MTENSPPQQPERRGFIKVLAVLFGSVAGLVPFGAGLAVFLDPLKRQTAAGDYVRVTSLEALPNDGKPRKFTVIASQTDAWNKFPETPIGAVYLRRTGEQTIQAFNVVCPHAGCFVDYLEARQVYLCPCHTSSFGLDGRVKDPQSPSPRGLDALEVQIRHGHEIWVRFRNFVAGHKEKVPVA